jgi:hypothetical protein
MIVVDKWSAFVIPAMVGGINVVAPDLLFKLSKLEFWVLPSTGVYVALVRSYVMRAAVTSSYVASFMAGMK